MNSPKLIVYSPKKQTLFTLGSFLSKEDFDTNIIIRPGVTKESSFILVHYWFGFGGIRRINGSVSKAIKHAIELAIETTDPVIIGVNIGTSKGKPLFKRLAKVVTEKADPLSEAAFEEWSLRLANRLGGVSADELATIGVDALEHVTFNYSAATTERIEGALSGYRSTIATPSNKLMRAQTLEIQKSLRPILRQVTNGVYNTPEIRANMASAFAIKDREVSRLLSSHHSFWLRDRHRSISTELSERARRIISEGVDLGLDRNEIAQRLKVLTNDALQMPGYFRVVAANHVARARSYSIGASYRAAGIEYFRIEAVLDDRTCFAAGTRVLLPNKKTLPIELIRPGDLVYSCKGIERRVRSLKVHQKKAWIVLNLSNGNTVRVTPNHPILTEYGWLKAGLLKQGDRIVEYSEKDSYGDLQKLWEDFQENTEVKVLLFRGVQSSGENMSMVRETVPSIIDISEAWARKILLRHLQVTGKERRIATGTNENGLRNLRKNIFFSSLDFEAWNKEISLLKKMREKNVRYRLQGLWKDIQTENLDSEILLNVLLSETYRRNEFRGNRKREIRTIGNKPQTGISDRQMVDRFSDRGENSSGSGRKILALGSKYKEERFNKRCSPIEVGLHSNKNRGRGNTKRFGVRFKSLEELCPKPRKDFAKAAKFVQIESLFGEINNCPAYDIEVDSDYGYIAEGVVVHNTHQCEFLHGKVLPVGESMARIDRVLSDPNPESILWHTPFITDEGNQLTVSTPDGHSRTVARIDRRSTGMDERGRPTALFSAGMSRADLVDAAIGMPPYHFGCRSTTVPL